MKGTEKGCKMMNERIRQVLDGAALKGMSETELFNLRGRLEAAHRMEEFRRLLPDVRVLEAADRVERVCESQLIGSPVDAYPVSAAPPAPVAPPAAPTPAPSASAPAVAVPEPVALPAEAVPVTPQGVQKRVMVTRHVARWPAIETDMKDAATNGLAAAAKAGARGWREAEALAWAESKGRLLSVPKPGSLDAVMGGGFTSIRHALDG